MTITLAERFLSITMTYRDKSGYKGYQGEIGNTHTLYVYTITDTRQIKKLGISSYSQDAIPTGVIQGRQPDILKIEGKLCKVSEVDAYLARLSSRSVNTIYNVLLPCSIVTATSTAAPEANGNWMVDMFKVKRNLQKRDIILFELVLYKWYGELPGSGA